MKQRDIWFADLSPTKGSEQSGVRPVVIVSGDSMNDNTGLCLVCPLSSKIKNYPATILLPKSITNGLTTDSEVLIFQMRVVTQQRFLTKIGRISATQLEDIVRELNDIFEI